MHACILQEILVHRNIRAWSRQFMTKDDYV